MLANYAPVLQHLSPSFHSSTEVLLLLRTHSFLLFNRSRCQPSRPKSRGTAFPTSQGYLRRYPQRDRTAAPPARGRRDRLFSDVAVVGGLCRISRVGSSVVDASTEMQAKVLPLSHPHQSICFLFAVACFDKAGHLRARLRRSAGRHAANHGALANSCAAKVPNRSAQLAANRSAPSCGERQF